ncbi:MAG: SDR family oxidoreductase [Actinobacteria bacterium]|nr:SDR family oxidoreductase [Actinomycetota bacterium]
MSAPTAVVTGATAGIGAAIAGDLAGRGYHVVVTGRDGEAAERLAAGLPDATGAVLDVTDEGAATAVAEAVVAEHGRLDAWVSNAGISHMAGFLDISAADLDRTLDVNVKGVFRCGQAAARAMLACGSEGSIVNLASIAGKSGRLPYLADYVASKFAVVGLTQAMAFELAPHKIRVNSVCPGFVVTPMHERELGWEANLRGTTVDAVRQGWIDDTPLGRLERPEDVAEAVAFLLGPASAYITGESLAVNGGTVMD